ncbi:MAG: NADH-quinone oxidoreductase subunit L [Pseudomonadota bacterium]
MELLAVFLPLIAFAVAGLFGKQLGDKGCQLVTCSAVIVAAFASIMLFFDVALGDAAHTTVLAPWVVSGDFNVSWALRIDTLSVVMMCVINIVSACVHVYSVGYMSHDESKGRFMAYLSLFTFAMLMLVTADNLLQLFFGWEGVGLASYLLIGFWNHKNSANAAAVKAFVVNRVGDFGLALGMFAVFVVFGSLQFDVIFEQAPEMAGTFFTFFGMEAHAITVIALLLFIGAIGKSAQLGLHTWLPDAMEGPTPVSALIHAATMVTAGVFLVARMSPLFEYAPDALMVVTFVGATTAFVAATIGLTQFDIKRVIAYSTMSQLGYMFFALGVSAYGAAMFHLVTHAFFKALLFLGAGSVIHAMSDEQDMRKMGGIWKKIPMTYGLMWIGSLALAGIPFFSGYYSKDIVLEAAWADHTWFGHYAYWMGIAAALMTAFYSWRLLIMTFHGEPRASKKVMSHIHESPAVMLGPLVILALGALFAGMLLYQSFVGSAHHHDKAHAVESVEPHAGADEADEESGSPTIVISEDDAEIVQEPESDVKGPHPIAEHLPMSKEVFWGDSIKVLAENDTVEAAHNVPYWVKKMPLLAGLLGIVLAYLAYMFRPSLPEKIKSIFSALHTLFFNKWFFDEIYNVVFVKTAFKLGQIFWLLGDQNTIDRFGPDGSAKSVGKLAGVISRFQSGFVYQYVFIMIIAVIAILSWFAFKGAM